MYQPYHEIDTNPETNQHLADIVRSIKTNGWQGLPLLAIGDQLLNGCHRLAACEILGVNPHVHQAEIRCTWGDSDYTDDLLESLAIASDSLSVLRALEALHAEGLLDDFSLRIIRAEYDKDNSTGVTRSAAGR